MGSNYRRIKTKKERKHKIKKHRKCASGKKNLSIVKKKVK